MKKHIAARLLRLIPVLLGVTILTFAMMRAAGSDAVQELYTDKGAVSAQIIAAKQAELGLDQPFFVQYFTWLRNFVRGDWGKSYVSAQSVLALFAAKLPATMELAALSAGLAAAVSLPLGVLAAVCHDRAPDRLIRVTGLVGNALPGFLTALLLMQVFSLHWKIFPVVSTGKSLRGAVLPALTLAISMSAKYTRQVRTAVLEELNRDYVAAAWARGVPARVTLWHSVLRAALPSLVTLTALSLGSLLGGTAVVESIFLWDGVGKMAVDAILMRDYPVIQAYVVWMGVIYLGVNLAADLLCAALDPRVRQGVSA